MKVTKDATPNEETRDAEIMWQAEVDTMSGRFQLNIHHHRDHHAAMMIQKPKNSMSVASHFSIEDLRCLRTLIDGALAKVEDLSWS